MKRVERPTPVYVLPKIYFSGLIFFFIFAEWPKCLCYATGTMNVNFFKNLIFFSNKTADILHIGARNAGTVVKYYLKIVPQNN